MDDNSLTKKYKEAIFKLPSVEEVEHPSLAVDDFKFDFTRYTV